MLLLFVFVLPATLYAGHKDTIFPRPPVLGNKLLNNIFQDAFNSLKKDPGDTLNHTSILFSRSEAGFTPYEGRYIRHIAIQRYGFETSFTDTASRINYIGTRILNALHTDTREYVIRNSLFIREHTPLHAYKLADNERLLRTISFIQDARIIVIPVPGTEDSVDLTVITKDLFSINGSLNVAGIQETHGNITESNLMGTGQHIGITGQWKKNRTPATSLATEYGINNIRGSFISGTVAYSAMSTGSTEEEQTLHFSLRRPLISPYSRIAGGADFLFGKSVNVYQKPDSSFRDYRYNSYDGWIAYNIHKRADKRYYLFNNERNRLFLSLRYRQTDFLKTPKQPGFQAHPSFQQSRTALASMTFFRQEFYKMNYLYGFGTTEDIPSGYIISLTGGWHKYIHSDRPYTGISAERFFVTPLGGFLHLVLQTGGYIQEKKLTDAGVLAGIDWYTRLLLFRRLKLREHIRFSFSQLHQRVAIQPLNLNNSFGLYEFNSDSVYGGKRLSAYVESIVYTDYKLFGFRFATFVYADGALLTPENKPFRKSDLYTGFGGGVRIRNENLIFGTIELRAGYLPRTITGVKPFHMAIRSQIHFRYRTSFIKAPDVADFNNVDF